MLSWPAAVGVLKVSLALGRVGAGLGLRKRTFGKSRAAMVMNPAQITRTATTWVITEACSRMSATTLESAMPSGMSGVMSPSQKIPQRAMSWLGERNA